MQWDSLFTNCVEYDPAAAEKPSLPSAGGVYLLTDAQDRLIQLASAGDLKRAIMQRLMPGGAAASAAPGQNELPAPAAMNSLQGSGPAGSRSHTELRTEAGEIAAGEIAPEPVDAEQSVADGAEGADAGGENAAASGAASAGSAAGHVDCAESQVSIGPSTSSRRRTDLSEIVRRIRWQPAHSAFEIAREYLRISRVIMPETYLKNLAFGPAWFVHVDPAATIPRFSVVKVLPGGDGVAIGPFSTQQDANKFVQAIEDAFDLCRYINILEQAPNGQPCAYYEMGRCPAPCGGLIPMSQYRETIAEAQAFAAGERQAVLQRWDQQMRDTARQLAFERAAAVKQRIERARELDHTAYRFVRPIESFSWLIVQRGGGRTRVRPFFMRGGVLEPGDSVKLKELEHKVPEWLQRMQPCDSQRPAPTADMLQVASEHIWLVSHFLFRREQSGLFFDGQRLPEPTTMIAAIRAQFTPPPSAAASATSTPVVEQDCSQPPPELRGDAD